MDKFLLIDVDGVLNPDLSPHWNVPNERESLGRAGWHIVSSFVMNNRPVWLNPEHGSKLLDIAERTGCELWWATSWHYFANQVICPVLGLPSLPTLFAPAGRKTEFVLPWAGERRFAWLDDEEYVIADCSFTGNGRGIKVDPGLGVTDWEFMQAQSWLEGSH